MLNSWRAIVLCRNKLVSSASSPRTKHIHSPTKASRHMVKLFDFIRSSTLIIAIQSTLSINDTAFIKVVEQLGNSFLATIQVTISFYSLHRTSCNILLLLLYLKYIYSICHGNIGKVPLSRIDAIWNKGRHVYESQRCQTGHHRGAWCDPHLAHMEPHIPNNKNINAVLDIYPKENITYLNWLGHDITVTWMRQNTS